MVKNIIKIKNKIKYYQNINDIERERALLLDALDHYPNWGYAMKRLRVLDDLEDLDLSPKERFMEQSFQLQREELFERERELMQEALERYPRWTYALRRLSWHNLPFFHPNPEKSQIRPRKPLRLGRDLSFVPKKETMEKLCFVIGASSQNVYFDLSIQLLESIKATRWYRNIPICVLDCGLTSEDRAYLIRRFKVRVKKPRREENIRFEGRLSHFSEHEQICLMSQPFMHTYFPGYDYYFWLNSDLWVQDDRALDKIVWHAQRDGVGMMRHMDFYCIHQDQLQALSLKILKKGIIPADSGFRLILEDYSYHLSLIEVPSLYSALLSRHDIWVMDHILFSLFDNKPIGIVCLKNNFKNKDFFYRVFPQPEDVLKVKKTVMSKEKIKSLSYQYQREWRFEKEKQLMRKALLDYPHWDYVHKRLEWHKRPLFHRDPEKSQLQPRKPLYLPRNDQYIPKDETLASLCFVTASGSDQPYFNLSIQLLESLKATRWYKDIPIKILDCGLTDDDKAYLKKRFNAEIKDPGWDVDLNLVERKSQSYMSNTAMQGLLNGWKGLTARPYIHKHFPGYDYYFWMDTDTWVQDERGIDEVIWIAERQGVSIAQPFDNWRDKSIFAHTMPKEYLEYVKGKKALMNNIYCFKKDFGNFFTDFCEEAVQKMGKYIWGFDLTILNYAVYKWEEKLERALEFPNLDYIFMQYHVHIDDRKRLMYGKHNSFLKFVTLENQNKRAPHRVLFPKGKWTEQKWKKNQNGLQLSIELSKKSPLESEELAYEYCKQEGYKLGSYFYRTYSEPDDAVLYDCDFCEKVKTKYGFEMYISNKDKIVSKWIKEVGFWEPQHYKLLHKILFSGARVIHLGGHIGYHDMVISSLIGETGMNYVFEPNPESNLILEKNIKDFNLKNTRLHKKGAWNEKTSKTIYFNYDNTGGCSLIEQEHFSQSYSIDSVRLDDYLLNMAPIDLLFMDIEGAELYAIEGAENILKQSPQCVILMEWSTKMLRAMGSDIEAFLKSSFMKDKYVYKVEATGLISLNEDLEQLMKEDVHIDIAISPRKL